jgi:predicted Zn-dependent peptidase
VLVVVGDFETADAKKWIHKYFSSIESATLPPRPNLTEPKQEQEQRFVKEDKLASKPAIAIAYKMPDKNTPEYYAMGLIDQVLVQGKDSKLYQSVVQQKGYASNISGRINYLGNMFNYNGPMFWMANCTYDTKVNPDSIIAQFDKAVDEISAITKADLDLALVKMRSQLYDILSGLGKVDLLASFALFDNDPDKINKLEEAFKKVSPELVKKTAKEYLHKTNRTILIIDPKANKP